MILKVIRLTILGAVVLALGVLALYLIPKAYFAEAVRPTSVPAACIATAVSNPKEDQTESTKQPAPQAPASYIWNWRFAGAAICLFLMLMGRLTSYAWNIPVLAPLAAGGRKEYPKAQTAVQVGLTALLLFSALALGYETLAVARGMWAVTDYIHCAYDSNTWLTIVLAGALSFVLGNWLWHVTPAEAASGV